MTTNKNNRICLGAFAGAHGVKGDIKVKTFTERPQNIAVYGQLESEDGTRVFSLQFLKVIKDDFALARAPEIKSREDAESLKGVRLYVSRDALPEPDEDEFYMDDLVGLAVIDDEGQPSGCVKAVYNFGSGDLLEIEKIPYIKGVRLVAFTKENVPTVNLCDGVITITQQAITASGKAE